MTAQSLLASLARLYPSDRLLTRPAQLVAYESDALTAFRERPLAVVLPETQQEVIDTVRLCFQSDTPFVARGSGTSLSGGSLPVPGGIVIGLNRLNRILRLDPQARLAVVEPGVINLDVSKAAAPFGLYYAPDPSSQPVCTIGGNVAFNSGGAHCLKYGMTSNHVLGLKAVLADGEVITLGGSSLESLGPDLTGFFVGCEGLFGIALEITLRLLPKVERYQTLLAAYHSLEAAGHAVGMIVGAGLLPGALEIMDRLAMDAAEAAVGAGYPAAAQGLLIVEMEGERAQVEAEFKQVLAAIEASGAYEVRVAQDEAQRIKIWKGRKGAFSAVGRLSPDYIVQDGVVPRTRLGEALAAIGRLSQQYGMRVANVFHAGDGNLHPLILYNGREAGALARAEEMAGDILRLCVQLGGSITGEHGIGVEKRAYLPVMFDAVDIDVMQRLRLACDPKMLANRGKMFPPADASPSAAAVLAPPPLHPAGRLSIADVQDAVRSGARVHVRGGGSKPALSTPPAGAAVLELGGLAGVLEYEPAEFTFTALAGTPVAEVANLLASHGQYLPFDPPFAAAGATLGGVVASGLSGPGRFRYGGVRDFILNVRFVDGRGSLVRSGGKVVKNAAGFDLPKLMVGSRGRLGVLVELTFKVLPRPQAYATLQLDFPTPAAALEACTGLMTSPRDIEALDLAPHNGGMRGWVRIGGIAETLAPRLERLQRELRGGEILHADDALWQERREFGWAPPGSTLVKVPLTPTRLPVLEAQLAARSAARHYSAGSNVAWIAAQNARQDLHADLAALGLTGMVVTGAAGVDFIGAVRPGMALAQRVKHVLDPEHRFGEV